MASADDPDDLALLLVQQFLAERGYGQALRETERAHGLTFQHGKLPRGSMLLELVYGHLEREAAAAGGDGSDAADQQAEEEALLQGGAADYPSAVAHTIGGRHSANVTAVCHCPRRDLLITGTGDGTVQLIGFDGSERWRQSLPHGGVISLALHPAYRQGDARLAVGTMDGSVCLLDAAAGTLLRSCKAHAKYVVRVRWAPCGGRLVSGSWDGSLQLFAAAGAQADGPGSGEAALRPVRSVPFGAAVQDFTFLPDGSSLVVALRDTNYLRVRSFPDIEREVTRVNLNSLGDDHVSFCARQLAVSPDGRLLLVSTDGPRILLLRIQGWRHLRSQIYGLSVENFHNPVALWHASGFYLMAAAAAGHVAVFHVGSGKAVAQFKAHEKNVRWLDYDAERNLLLTCSFDRTVKVYAAAAKEPGS